MNVKRLLITPDLFIEACKAGDHAHRVSANPLPGDARWVSASFDHEHNCISIMVESDAFHDVPVGNVVERLPPVMFEDISHRLAPGK